MKNRSLPILFTALICLLSLLFVLLPKKERSEKEKRLLASWEAPTAESVADGTFRDKAEEYLGDHFPFREAFVGIDAYRQLLCGLTEINGVYRTLDGALAAAPTEVGEERLTRNLETLEALAQSFDGPSVLLAVPEAGRMRPLPVGAAAYPDDEIIKKAASCPSLTVPDLTRVLEGADYFRTDHHLSGAGSLKLYRQACSAFALEEKAFTLSLTHEGFRGTAYAKSGLWLEKPDVLDVYSPCEKQNVTVTLSDGVNESVGDSLYFPAHLDEDDQYPYYLDGNHALVRIQTGEGKKLLIIRDSFAHCLATDLAASCGELVLIDPRYYRGSVAKIMKEEHFDGLLFVFGCDNLASSTDFGWLKR